MMNKKLIINKGYTLEVVSWENDGDHYDTRYMTFDDKKAAKATAKICIELFECENSGNNKGIGNAQDNENDNKIDAYFKLNPTLIEDIGNNTTYEEVVESISDKLLGYSDYYRYRVCESAVITYSPKDVKLKIIEY